MTEDYIKNTTFLRLSHDFNAVFLAAAYLNLIKGYLTADEQEPWTVLPDIIGQHAWFQFVDPAIDQASLEHITAVLNDEITFFDAVAQ